MLPGICISLPKICVMFLITSLLTLGVIYFLNAEVDYTTRMDHDRTEVKIYRSGKVNSTAVEMKGTDSMRKIAPLPENTIHSPIRTEFANLYPNFQPKFSQNSRKLEDLEDPKLNERHRFRHHKKKSKYNNRTRTELHDVILTHPTKKNIVVGSPQKEQCYQSDDVLSVIGITCLLNFSFILVVWCSVSWVNRRAGGGTRWKIRKKQKFKKKGRPSWEEMSDDSDDTDVTTSSTESSSSDFSVDEEENRPLKSYSMEDLRFYYG
ncbi:uncharacterized protein LOC118433156 [Folsomia candida]|uniref:Uncharacterized protein n=1 Tax=Folsomia candida TaxID=158441 RepID=A0A226D0N1_FOLCA|nr:uncharacterized protein LOC118433156 [Folsomia candida]OXA38769.1 hypothetical protein Fcan01_26450 [Folsomia candida]